MRLLREGFICSQIGPPTTKGSVLLTCPWLLSAKKQMPYYFVYNITKHPIRWNHSPNLIFVHLTYIKILIFNLNTQMEVWLIYTCVISLSQTELVIHETITSLLKEKQKNTVQNGRIQCDVLNRFFIMIEKCKRESPELHFRSTFPCFYILRCFLLQ